MVKFMDKIAVAKQSAYAPSLAPFLQVTATLMGNTVYKMLPGPTVPGILPIRQKNGNHARSWKAEKYWAVYFEFYTNSNCVPVAFGYDLDEWKKQGIPLPPWRVLVYDTPIISAIQKRCTNIGIVLYKVSPVSNPHHAVMLWIPVWQILPAGIITAQSLAVELYKVLGTIIP